MRLAIVSPCFNEEAVLAASAARLTELFDNLVSKEKISSDSFELFVNDGSNDATWSVISDLHDKNHYIKGLNLSHNVGHQNAIMAGMMTAKDLADVVITMDADLQDDLNAVEQMIDAYNEGNDIVYGVKVSRTADPILKRISAMAFYKLQSSMGVECIYNHADFRLMSKKALNMLSCYHEKNLYLRALIPQIGLKSTTVEDTISERTAGKSKYTLGKMLNLALDGITSFSVKPIYCIVYTGMIIVLLGFLGIVVDVIIAITSGLNVPGWVSIMLSMWLIGGLLMLSIGAIGVYIGKMYKEVKARPLYHISDFLE
ncbi:MAG: glycosyltransferase family 2 protein [Prevotella sp.]|nr:glycosyltransferase family 2 protein [Prevotella sp.]